MVVFTFAALTTAAALFAQNVIVVPSPSVDANGIYVRRAASCTFPSPPKTSSLGAAKVITGTFDGGNVRYDRGKGVCGGQAEGAARTPLRNVVIGANQAEGVRCLGPCNIYNTSGTSNIVGGGAKNASGKVVQHNGGVSVKIDSYCVQDFGKLYCACIFELILLSQYKRSVSISNVVAKNGKLIAGVKSSYVPIRTSFKSICDTFQGNNKGDEPPKLTSNKSNAS
ncbi:pectin lyase-like protein [Ceratobasidium sp. AG-I]|nr:pectin lyase-like protein [Ceratobasidium sp. AG-I]